MNVLDAEESLQENGYIGGQNYLLCVRRDGKTLEEIHLTMAVDVTKITELFPHNMRIIQLDLPLKG